MFATIFNQLTFQKNIITAVNWRYIFHEPLFNETNKRNHLEQPIHLYSLKSEKCKALKKKWENTGDYTRSYIPNDDDCLPKLDETLSLIFSLHYI